MKPYIAAPAIAALVYRAWSKKSLTNGGIVTAFLTAVVHAIHPWSGYFVLLTTFFLAGTAVTKVKHDIKAKLTKSASGSAGGEGPRNHIQVLANSFAASVLVACHAFKLRHAVDDVCWGRNSDAIVVGIVANYAAVTADTFSSELGILSKHTPRLITAPWRSVPRGTNGGVTFAGLLAGLGGALLIAVTSTVALPLCYDWETKDKAKFILGITFAGFCGTLLDSFLGAVFQASVVDTRSGKVVEGDGGRKVLIHSSSQHVKPSAKLRSEVISYEDAGESVAKTSAREGGEDTPRKRQAEEESEDTDDEDTEHHESRKVAVGFDILDNNAVNLVMATTISYVSWLIACDLWKVKFEFW